MKKIGIILGSISDKAIAEKCVATLQELNLEFEVTVASAHRTPDDVARYAATARDRGLGCIIAVAGLSAALPGSVAACTTLPVVGLPVSGGALNGQEALWSMAQMPPGVPVASVGIDAGANAALLAARILSALDDDVAQRLEEKRRRDAEKVRTSRESLDWPKPQLS